MALELGTEQFQMEQLEKKYRNFFAPAYEILVDGTKIADEIAVSSIRIETTIESTADSFSFRISNAYDIAQSELKWVDKFTLGKTIDIKLGYVDKYVLVFSGYITSVTADFPNGSSPGIIVRGMDLSYLMMKGTKSRTWNKKKYSDIVKEIASEYGATAKVDATTTEFPAISQSNIDDFHFIQHMANMVNYDFFMVGKNLYFRKALTAMTPVLILELGKSLQSLSIDMNLADQITEVSVRGWDDKELKVVEGKSGTIQKLGSGAKTGKDLLAGQGTFTEYIYTNVSAQEEAKSYADALLNKRSMKLISGGGECIGIPDIRAGRYIKLNGLGTKFNQPYYLVSVTHIYDDDGYITRFQIGGNAV
jgi:phage protein D